MKGDNRDKKSRSFSRRRLWQKETSCWAFSFGLNWFSFSWSCFRTRSPRKDPACLLVWFLADILPSSLKECGHNESEETLTPFPWMPSSLRTRIKFIAWRESRQAFYFLKRVKKDVCFDVHGQQMTKSPSLFSSFLDVLLLCSRLWW